MHVLSINYQVNNVSPLTFSPSMPTLIYIIKHYRKSQVKQLFNEVHTSLYSKFTNTFKC